MATSTRTERRNRRAPCTASRNGTAADAGEPQDQPQCGSFAEPEALPAVLEQEVLEDEDAPLKTPHGISVLKELFPHHAGEVANVLLLLPSPSRSRSSLPVVADVPPVTGDTKGPDALPVAHQPNPWEPVSGVQAACYRDRLRARGQCALQRGFDRGLMPKAMRQAGPPPLMAGPPPGPLPPTLEECAARHYAMAPQMCAGGPQTCFWGASQVLQCASQGPTCAYWGASPAAVQAPVLAPQTMALQIAKQQQQTQQLQMQLQMQMQMQMQMPPQMQQAPQAPQVQQAEMAPQVQQAPPQAQPQPQLQPNPELMASLLPHCSFPLNRMEMAARLMTAADCQYED